VGTRVRYRLDGEASDREAVLAGWDDGEPAERRLSYNSPLGAALLGAGMDDEREVTLAGRTRSIVVVAIEPAEDT
jgi:transcription elongation GreA/GreB family factor